MPHIIVEHSANLSTSHDMQGLANIISAAAVKTGVFPLAGIRVRMHPVKIYAMADGHKDNAFIAVVMRIGAGRDLEIRQGAARAVYNVICENFTAEIERGFMAITVDMEINDPDVSFKRNGVRDRLEKEMDS